MIDVHLVPAAVPAALEGAKYIFDVDLCSTAHLLEKIAGSHSKAVDPVPVLQRLRAGAREPLHSLGDDVDWGLPLITDCQKALPELLGALQPLFEELFSARPNRRLAQRPRDSRRPRFQSAAG